MFLDVPVSFIIVQVIMQGDSESENDMYLDLLLEDQHIMLGLPFVKMVLAIPALQKAPDPQPAFRGILNFHSKAIPVYDLLTLLDAAKKTIITTDTALVLTTINNNEIGLLTAQVEGLIKIDITHLQKAPNDAMRYVKYLYETEKKSGWILDLDTLVSHHQLKVKSETHHE